MQYLRTDNRSRCRWSFLQLAYFGIMVYVLSIHDLLEQMGEFGRYGAWMLLGTANMMFLCYDYTMKNSTVLYERYLKPKIYPKQ